MINITNYKKYLIILSIITTFLISPVYSYAGTYTGNSTITTSKKGLQGAHPTTNSTDSNLLNSTDLGIQHTLYNIYINDLVASQDSGTPYEYKGKTYYFRLPNENPYFISQMNDRNISVSFVLLLGYNASQQNLIYPSGREPGHNYYALNTATQDGHDTFEALFNFLADNYSTEKIHVDNWILGNEVNVHKTWNYSGINDINANANAYADAFKLLSDAVKSHSQSSRVFVSVDHCWNETAGGNQFSTKSFLDAFNNAIKAKQADIQWGIAFHAYPADLRYCDIWSSTWSANTTDNESTQFITCKNIDVLTNYVKTHYGPDTRIILSEQGFNAYNGDSIQAAALAYSYYKSEFNDMIDAFIIRSDKDYQSEISQGLKFGLTDINGNKRQSYNVFKYMDTDQYPIYTNFALNIIGTSDWSYLVSNFDSRLFLANSPNNPYYSSVYNTDWYLSHNPDLYNKYKSNPKAALIHFIQCGMKEGREASSNFNVKLYRQKYPDLNTAFGNNWEKYFEHYLNIGISEGRTANSITDNTDTDNTDTDKPDTNKPDTNKPDTDKPDTNKPDTNKPDTDKPDTDKPDTNNTTNTPSDNTPNKTYDNSAIKIQILLLSASVVLLLNYIYKKHSSTKNN